MNARTFILIASLAVHSGLGQGTFQNLGFENTTVPPTTPNGTLVPFSSAFPGWVGYFDATPATFVRYNNISLGTPGFSLFTSNSNLSAFEPLAGRYTALLQGGSVPQSTNVSLAQTATLPSDALSLRLLVGGSPSNLMVTLNGQPLSLTLLQTYPKPNFFDYYEYGGDISAFAGQTAELRFISPLNPSGAYNVLLDAIRFSNLPVPEPGTWALVVLGTAAFWCAARHRRK